MRFDGTLKSWNDERGFGFIAHRHGGQDIFVHIKSFPAGTGRPSVGLRVSFEIEAGPDGKKRARAVQFPPSRSWRMPERLESTAPWTVPRLLAIPLFLFLYWHTSIRWSLSPSIAMAYVFVSICAFFAYALDKSAARHKRWRTSESTLLLIGLACGWPGALLAQQMLRHKTSKASFVARFWVTVAANVAAFYVLSDPKAASLFTLLHLG